MERVRLPVLIAATAALLLSGLVLYARRGAINEQAPKNAALPGRTDRGSAPAPADRGRLADSEWSPDARGNKASASRSRDVGKGRDETAASSAAGEAAMAAVARRAQTLTVGGARTDGNMTGTGGTLDAPVTTDEAIDVTLPATGGPVAPRGRIGTDPANAPRAAQPPPADKPVDGTAPNAPPAATNQNDLLLSVPLHGSTQVEEGLTQPIVEQDVKPDDSGQGMKFPEKSVLEFPDANSFIKPDAGTISLDIQPGWNGVDAGDNSFVQVKTPEMWQGNMALLRNGVYMVFRFNDETGQDHNIGVDISNWAPGDRHTVAATWGEALMSLYIDGQLAGQNTYSASPSIPPNMPLFLGSNPNNHVPGAAATLENFKVFGRALTPEEIAAQ